MRLLLMYRITAALLTMAHNTQSLLPSIFLSEPPSFPLTHAFSQASHVLLSKCSKLILNWKRLSSVFLCLVSFSRLTLPCHFHLSRYFSSMERFFWPSLSQAYAMSFCCVLWPYDPHHNLHLSYLCAWSLAVSSTRGLHPGPLREGIMPVLLMLMSTYKDAWHIAGNSTNICQMNRKEATRLYSQGGRQRRNRPSGHCVGHLVCSTHLCPLPMGT